VLSYKDFGVFVAATAAKPRYRFQTEDKICGKAVWDVRGRCHITGQHLQ
jgi:hypothetical protein